VMFALRQLCVDNSDIKFRVGNHCIAKLIEDMGTIVEFGPNSDFLFNAITFLYVLCGFAANAELCQKADIQTIIAKIRDDPDLYDKKLLKNKLMHLTDLIHSQTHQDLF
jgi:hypothetical protein